MSIADALIGLDNQRKALAVNLVAKGVTASGAETLADLVPKVLAVPQEGGSGSSFYRKTIPIIISTRQYNPSIYAVEVIREV